MDIFRHRPLFLWCTAFAAASAGGFLLFGTRTLANPSAQTLLVCMIALLFALGIGVGLALWLTHRRRQAVTLLLAAVLSTLGLLQAYASFAGAQTRRLQALEGQTVAVTGVITERRGGGGYISSFSVELDAVDGQDTDGMAVLTCYYNADLHAGDAVEIRTNAVPLDEIAGDGYSAVALLGDGYVLGLVSETEADVTVTGKLTDHIFVRMGVLRHTLATRLDAVLDKRAAGLPSALLLGDRSDLPDNVRRDFARAGVSHLLAISGLHMTLLFGLLAGLLRLCRLPRRPRAVLLGLAAFGYLVMLGFPPSATRAVVMLGFVYLSSLLFLRADPLTSLGVAGFLILTVTPHAAADAGFWMSYLATLSLLSVMPWVNRLLAKRNSDQAMHPWLTRAGNVLRKIGVGLLVGVVAMSSTLSVVAAVIGETGILSPVTTLLLTPLCGAVLLLSLVALPLAHTPAGLAVGSLINLICGAMTDLAARMASPRWVVVSLTHPAVLPVAVIMLVVILVLLGISLSERRRWLIAAPLLAGWLAIFGILTVSHHMDGDSLKVSFLQPSSQADMLVLVEGRDAVICDFSNGSVTSMTAATTEASRRGATEVAALVLTHYHRSTAGTLYRLLGRETVRALWVPYPIDEDDYYFLLDCIEKAEDAGVPVTVYREGESLRVFGTGRMTLQTDALKRSTQPVLLLTLDTDPTLDGRGELVYCGSAVFESGLSYAAASAVSSADVVILGNHGPLVKRGFGADLTLREHARVVISEKGDVAACLQTDGMPESVDLWLGQRRFTLP